MYEIEMNGTPIRDCAFADSGDQRIIISASLAGIMIAEGGMYLCSNKTE